MATLKRRASAAFLEDDVANDCDPPSSTAASSRRKPGLQTRTSSGSRRANLSRSPSQARQSSGSRSPTLQPPITVSATSYRTIKRQRTNPPEEWDSSTWEVVEVPLESGTIVQTLRPTLNSSPTPPSSSQNSLMAAAYRLFSSLGLASTNQISCPPLPHLANQPEVAIYGFSDDKSSGIPINIDSSEPKPDADVSMTCDEEEEACVISLLRTASVTTEVTSMPSLPESPVSSYTPHQWSLLSRHPHLVAKVLSDKCQAARRAHAHFVSSNFTIETNPKLRPQTLRRSSLLAPSTPTTFLSPQIPKLPPITTTHRLVVAAQKLGAPPSRWRNYPTCTKKYPGPERPGSLYRNCLLLNFGDWLSSINLWTSINIGGIHTAIRWYEEFGNQEEGTLTPTVSSPSGSVANLMEFETTMH